jgi:PAP2 superfamily
MTATLNLSTKRRSLTGLVNWAFPHPLLWAVVTAMLLCNAVAIYISNHLSIEPGRLSGDAQMLGFATALMLLRQFYNEIFDGLLHRVWCVFMAALFASILFNNLLLLNHVLMANSFPMADDRLLSWDRALGLDWLAYAKFMTSSSTVQNLLYLAYQHMTYGGVALVAVALVALNLRVRTIELAFLLTGAAVVCLTVAAAFPARAAMDVLADKELFQRIYHGLDGFKAGFYHIEQLMELRGDAPVLIKPATLEGLATFPSFHTCLAIIIMWCSRGHWITGSIGKIVAVMILAATPIFGGHYFVDIMAGAVVMTGLILLWRRFIVYRLAEQVPGMIPGNHNLPVWLNLKRAT